MTSLSHLLDRPIFVVGPGRSGTTLLRSLLSAHSAISITPETQFMKWVSDGEDVRGTPRDFERFWDKYTSWVRFQDLGVDPSRCRKLLGPVETPTFEQIFRAALLAYGERTGARRVGEKSPSHVFFIEELLDWFPTATILAMERDPRAVIASQLKTPYVRERISPPSLRGGILLDRRSDQIARFAAEWGRIHGIILPQWRDDSRVSVVSYEALVLQPEAEVRKLCRLLDEPFEPSMLAERSPAESPPPAGVARKEELERWRREHHARSRTPISSGSLEKWRRELRPNDVALIESICGDEMQEAGYEPETGRLRRSWAATSFRALRSAEAVERKVRSIAPIP